jgi:hypothetical protein
LAPYCPLPFEEANKPGVSCNNKSDENKLEKDNPNVICTFTRTISGIRVIIDPNSTSDKDPENATFDTCTPNPDGSFTCSVSLRIFPNIRIPWLAAIWNNTLYSDEGENLPGQKTGRPGIFGFFTPKSIALSLGQDKNITELLKLQGECRTATEAVCLDLVRIWATLGCDPNMDDKNFAECLGYSLNKPGEAIAATPEDAKERFIGGVDDIGKNFTKSCALRPKAVRDLLGSGCRPQL